MSKHTCPACGVSLYVPCSGCADLATIERLTEQLKKVEAVAKYRLTALLARDKAALGHYYHQGPAVGDAAVEGSQECHYCGGDPLGDGCDLDCPRRAYPVDGHEEAALHVK